MNVEVLQQVMTCFYSTYEELKQVRVGGIPPPTTPFLQYL